MNFNTAATLIILGILTFFCFMGWNISQYELRKLEICSVNPESEVCD